MPKQATKIKLTGLNKPASTTAAAVKNSATSKNPATAIAQPQPPRSQLLPGGVALWCLMGLAIGLGVWLGGRSYLKSVLAAQLVSASSEEVALKSIDALLRLDANATIEVSRGLAHPEFMVANAAFRALGGQLDVWAKLEPADRLLRMQKVVVELERMPEEMDQDHRILVSGLVSRIYADTLSNREAGAGEVLEACRRIMARHDPQYLHARTARLDKHAALGDDPQPPAALPSALDDLSPVPPPLDPLEPAPTSRMDASSVNDGASESTRPTDQAHTDLPKRAQSPMSLSDAPRVDESASRMHLTAGPASLPQATTGARHQAAAVQTLPTLPRLSTQADADPLSTSASSRSRVIPQGIEPIPGPAGDSHSVAALSGIEQLPIDQLVRLLASVQPRVSQAAALTLRERGMSAENLELAIQLATGSVETRQQLLTELVQRDDLDARPWLLWMAADGQELVRQHAIALLMPLADSDVKRQLRLLLNKERDEKVAQTIRQVLAGKL